MDQKSLIVDGINILDVNHYGSMPKDEAVAQMLKDGVGPSYKYVADADKHSFEDEAEAKKWAEAAYDSIKEAYDKNKKSAEKEATAQKKELVATMKSANSATANVDPTLGHKPV
jgi:hypothetical protein